MHRPTRSDRADPAGHVQRGLLRAFEGKRQSLRQARLTMRFSLRKSTVDPYWEAFIHRPPNDPNNSIPHAFQGVHPGGVNPVRTEIHSPNVQTTHLKELGRFFGAHEVRVIAAPSNPDDLPFAIVCALQTEYDT